MNAKENSMSQLFILVGKIPVIKHNKKRVNYIRENSRWKMQKTQKCDAKHNTPKAGFFRIK